jgi:hypothetical protein
MTRSTNGARKNPGTALAIVEPMRLNAPLTAWQSGPPGALESIEWKWKTTGTRQGKRGKTWPALQYRGGFRVYGEFGEVDVPVGGTIDFFDSDVREIGEDEIAEAIHEDIGFALDEGGWEPDWWYYADAEDNPPKPRKKLSKAEKERRRKAYNAKRRIKGVPREASRAGSWLSGCRAKPPYKRRIADKNCGPAGKRLADYREQRKRGGRQGSLALGNPPERRPALVLYEVSPGAKGARYEIDAEGTEGGMIQYFGEDSPGRGAGPAGWAYGWHGEHGPQGRGYPSAAHARNGARRSLQGTQPRRWEFYQIGWIDDPWDDSEELLEWRTPRESLRRLVESRGNPPVGAALVGAAGGYLMGTSGAASESQIREALATGEGQAAILNAASELGAVYGPSSIAWSAQDLVEATGVPLADLSQMTRDEIEELWEERENPCGLPHYPPEARENYSATVHRHLSDLAVDARHRFAVLSRRAADEGNWRDRDAFNHRMREASYLGLTHDKAALGYGAEEERHIRRLLDIAEDSRNEYPGEWPPQYGVASPTTSGSENPPKLLPLAPADRKWDADAARKRIARWAKKGRKSIDWPKYRRAFLYTDPRRETVRAGYKLPVADVIKGRLYAVPHAIEAIAGVLDGARGGIRLPAEARKRIRRTIGAYYWKMGHAPPWERENHRTFRQAGGLNDQPSRRIGKYLSQANPPTRDGKWYRNVGNLDDGKTAYGYSYFWGRTSAAIIPYKPRRSQWARRWAGQYEERKGAKVPKGTRYLLVWGPFGGTGDIIASVSAHKTLAAAKKAGVKALKG